MTRLASINVRITQPESLHLPEKPIPQKKILLLISFLGTMVEYFDYSLYGFMAVPLAQYFFPTQDSTIALLQAFGVFAIGSLAKPFGALIFGRIGDFTGRSAALRYSFLGISGPTIVVGCLPGYESIGAWALLILILCRLAQGIFVSGESDGVRIYIQEHFSDSNRTFATNLSSSGAYLGITLASLMAALVATTDWWRLPFFLSGSMGLTIFIVRQYLIETPVFLNVKENRSFVKNRDAYLTNWKGILRTILVCGAGGGCYHLYLVFWGTFQSKILGYISVDQATSRATIMAFVYTISLPLIGWVADRIGLYKVIKAGALLSFVMVGVNAWTMTSSGTPFLVLFLTVLSVCIFTAPCFVLLTQQFDPAVRFRCLSIGHSIGSMIFSGSTPAINMALWAAFQWEYTPLLYFAGLLSMGWGAIWWLHSKRC